MSDEATEEPPRALPPPSASSRRSDHAAARPITNPRLRRLYGWETLVVLAIFPLGATIAAVTFLLMRVETGVEYSSDGLPIPGHFGPSLVLALAVVASGFAAAGLVIYLLIRNGEGIDAIGLGGHRLRKDLALVLPVWIVVQVIPQELGSALASTLHLPRYDVAGPALPAAFISVALLMSLQAAVVEEIVVLGYLVRRLEQRGWSAGAVVVVAVLVRVSYHLYYGPGVLPIVLWATTSVIVYRWLRRLLPFIICHFAWDASISINELSHTAAVVFNVVFFAAALVCLLLWSREPTPPVPQVAF